MWGDADHIKRLKKEEPPPWPDTWPDPKKAKKTDKADRAAQKAAGAEARKLAKWERLPPAKPAKQPPATKRPTPAPADIANLKAEAWEAKQQQKAMKDAWRAQQDLLKAEKAAAKLARWQAAEDLRLQREMAALGKAAEQRDRTPVAYGLYAPESAASYTAPGIGCAGPALALLLAALILLLLLCVCDCA